MATDLHRVAEGFMGEGDHAAAAGDAAAAAHHYRQAADAEAAAFDSVSVERPRTRSVLAISSVALYRRAGDRERAVQQAHKVLSQDGLAPEARQEVEMLLDELHTEQLAGLEPQKDGLQWALRGGRVGYGVARLETVGLKIEQIQRFAWRVCEFMLGRELRTTTPAPPDVREAVDLLVSQPVAGSFTFTVRLGGRQLSFDGIDVNPQEVTGTLDAIVRAVQAEDPDALDSVVPDAAYRSVFMRLVRNLAPDGREVGEVELRHVGSTDPPTILTPVVRSIIRRRLPRVPVPSGAEETELRGVLRVIDLNRSLVALGPKEHEQRCHVPEGLALVDLIEGLEDRRVRVKGHWRGKSFVVHDIEADYGDE